MNLEQQVQHETNKVSPEVTYRMASEVDIPFIFNSWLQSYRKSPSARNITNTTFYSEHHKIIEQCLKNSLVVMAVDKEDPNNIYGYIVAEQVEGYLVVHFIYVKHTFRNLKIGTSLLNQFERSTMGFYTHHTFPMEKLSVKWNLIYNPYLLNKKSEV